MIRPPRPSFSPTSGVRRREFIAAAAAGFASLFGPSFCLADDRPPVSADVVRAVTEGFKFLDKQQNREGSFQAEGEAAIAVAARALLAFLAAGQVPDVARHGLAVRRTIDWLLDQQAALGWYGPSDLGIRPHLSATTALSQAYGVEGNAERRISIHASVGKAVGAILSRQVPGRSPSQPGGGWSTAQPDTRSQNLAVTALSLFALHACATIGFPLAQPVTSRALDFTLRCFDPSAGGFAPAPGQHADLRSTCAGVVCLGATDASGAHAEPLNSAAKFILAHAGQVTAPPELTGGIIPLAALKLGNELWTAVAQPLMTRITKSQQKDGSWPSSKPPNRPEISRTAATASALSVLTMCYPLLPIYQH